MADVLSGFSASAAPRLSIHSLGCMSIRMARAAADHWARRLYGVLYHSVLQGGHVRRGFDAMPAAVLHDLNLERSYMSRIADAEARLRADALYSI